MRPESEASTIIKKILPYMKRKGYVPEKNLEFEVPVKDCKSRTSGAIDILVTVDNQAVFLVEAKRSGKVFTEKDISQALDYATAQSIQVPFVVLTNGAIFRCYNSVTKKLITYDDGILDTIPDKDVIIDVFKQFKKNKEMDVIKSSGKPKLPYRPSLTLKELNQLYCANHNIIRKIEKDEESAFADFSKILFLKLLEEKADQANSFELPYTFRFHLLAKIPEAQSDQAKSAIMTMITDISKNVPYGDILAEPLRIKKSLTFLKII